MEKIFNDSNKTSNNSNNVEENSFPNKFDKTRRQSLVAVNQKPENEYGHRKSKVLLGNKTYSVAGKHGYSTPNNNNIAHFSESIPSFRNVNMLSTRISILKE